MSPFKFKILLIKGQTNLPAIVLAQQANDSLDYEDNLLTSV